MIVDKTGRKVKVGQMIDLCAVGMIQGKIVDIKEVPIVLSPQQQINPHVVIMVTFTPYILPDGMVPEIYITADPDPKDPVVVNHESKNSKIQLVQ